MYSRCYAIWPTQCTQAMRSPRAPPHLGDDLRGCDDALACERSSQRRAGHAQQRAHRLHRGGLHQLRVVCGVRGMRSVRHRIPSMHSGLHAPFAVCLKKVCLTITGGPNQRACEARHHCEHVVPTASSEDWAAMSKRLTSVESLAVSWGSCSKSRLPSHSTPASSRHSAS